MPEIQLGRKEVIKTVSNVIKMKHKEKVIRLSEIKALELFICLHFVETACKKDQELTSADLKFNGPEGTYLVDIKEMQQFRDFVGGVCYKGKDGIVVHGHRALGEQTRSTRKRLIDADQEEIMSDSIIENLNQIFGYLISPEIDPNFFVEAEREKREKERRREEMHKKLGRTKTKSRKRGRNKKRGRRQ